MPHMDALTHTTDHYLRQYIPNVYQENIYAINYEKLKEKGIKMITFDVDDTLVPKGKSKLPKEAIVLVSDLKEQGFDVMLLSNSGDARVQGFADWMDVDYVARARKPSLKHFQEILSSHGLTKDQMAHVGNSIVNDVAGGNSFGITTCLVRPVAHEKEIARELKKRKLWYKHHDEKKGDQYYQLGEKQKGSI